MVRPPYCENFNWREEEDEKNLEFISKKGPANRCFVSRKAGLKRCEKSSRIRWNNNQKSDLNQESFTQHEDELIIKLHAAIGSRWTPIAQQLPGRTENEVKNHWNTKLKKKLTEMGIDPVTHKPFSQILADYGNIGGLSLSRTSAPPKHLGPIRKDFKKVTPTHIHNYANNHNNENTNSYASHHSLDLLSQLQAISLVTEGPSNPNANTNHFPTSNDVNNDNSSSLSSTSASSSVESFSWHDFLLDEDLQPGVQNQATAQEANNHATELLSIMQNNVEIGCSKSLASSSDGSLFLEAMLHQENDMFLNFPGLMEESLYQD